MLKLEFGQVLLTRHKSGKLLTSESKLRRHAHVITDLWRQVQNDSELPDGVVSLRSFGCHSDLREGQGKAFLMMFYPSSLMLPCRSIRVGR